MNLRGRFLTLAFGLPVVAPAAVADEGAVLPLMGRAAGWQPANPGRWKPHEWHNGVFHAGVMALACVSGSPRFREAMVRVGEKQQWQPGPRVMFIRGFVGTVIDNIRIGNAAFRGVTETEVVTHTGSVSMKNVTVLPAKLVRGLNSAPPFAAK